MSLQPSDLLLINRNGINFKIAAGDFTTPGHVLGTDLLMVQRGPTLYKVAKSELFSSTGRLDSTDFLLVQRGEELFYLRPSNIPSTTPYFQLGFTGSSVSSSENVLVFQWGGARASGGVAPQIRVSSPNGVEIIFLGTAGVESFNRDVLGNGVGQITVYGLFNRFAFPGSAGLVQLTQPSAGTIASMVPTPDEDFGQYMFRDCRQLQTCPIDMPLQSGSGMFERCTTFNGNISNMNVSAVSNFSNMFSGCSAFNRDVTPWDVSKATNMSFMFDGASVYNNSINAWGPSVGNVTNFNGMFRDASAYNKPMNTWDVSSALAPNNLNNFFNGASAFSQDLTSWCVTNFASEPPAFSANSSLTNAQLPVWGTCP